MKFIILTTVLAALSSVGYSKPTIIYPQASVNLQNVVPTLSVQTLPLLANSIVRTAQQPFLYSSSYNVPANIEVYRSEYPVVESVSAPVVQKIQNVQVIPKSAVVNPIVKQAVPVEISKPIVKQVEPVSVDSAPVVAAPVAVVKSTPMFKAAIAPVAPVNSPVISQFHAQDELGQYSYGYSGGPSSKIESKDAFGVVHGGFSYVDPVGDIQSQTYVADAAGFRTAGTNIPVGPSTA